VRASSGKLGRGRVRGRVLPKERRVYISCRHKGGSSRRSSLDTSVKSSYWHAEENRRGGRREKRYYLCARKWAQKDKERLDP